MDESEVSRLWDANAEVWTQLARAGFDAYRDLVNTPASSMPCPMLRVAAGSTSAAARAPTPGW